MFGDQWLKAFNYLFEGGLMSSLSRRFHVFAFLITLLIVCPTWAQFSQRSSISGFITDLSKAAIPGAKVTLKDIDRSQTVTATSDDTGRYEFSNLTIGHYIIEVEQTGFRGATSKPFELTTQQGIRLDFSLNVGQVVDAVDVSSSAPLLDTEHASVDQNVDQKQFQDLPINGRNFTSLTILAPGISTFPQANVNPGTSYTPGTNDVPGGVSFASGGETNGESNNGYYINGINATANYGSSPTFAPSTEAIQDAKISVSDFNAANGHDISSLTVSTKSGTSKFHGEAFEFVENDIFNARNPYDKALGLDSKPSLRRNQFGGNLGGPISFPKLFTKLQNRAFFFVNYERLEERDGLPNTTALVPSLAERAGDFSELLSGANPTQLYDPYSTTYDPNGLSHRVAVPGNRLDLAPGPNGGRLIDPASAAITSLFPEPNTPNTQGYNYVTTAKHDASEYRFDSRFDVTITSKNSLFFAIDWAKGTDNNLGGVFQLYTPNLSDYGKLFMVNDAHVFTANLTNEFIFGLGDSQYVTVPDSQLAQLNGDSNPFNQVFQNTGTGSNRGVLALNIYGYVSPGFNEIFKNEATSLQFSDNLTWTRGRHHMTFGVNYFKKGEQDFDFVRSISYGGVFNVADYSQPKEAFTQAGSFDNSVGGDGFADVLLGLPRVIHQRFNLTSGGPSAPLLDVFFPYWGAYFNDKVQLTPTLTLSAGVRWDLNEPIYAENNLCCALVDRSVPGWQLQIPGLAPGVPQHFLSAAKHNFAPRVSFAYEVNPKLVVRAGYGLFYNGGAGQIGFAVQQALTGIPGYFTGDELTNSRFGQPDDTPTLHQSQIFQTAPSVAAGTFPISTGPGEGKFSVGTFQDAYTFDESSAVVPIIHRFEADIQKEVASNAVVKVQYLGAQGRKGFYPEADNLPAYQVGWPSQSAYNAARPNNVGNFGTIYINHPGLNSFYNAGIVSFERRMSGGLQLLSHYTYSKTVSDTSGWNYHVHLGRGESPTSHRHRLLVSAIYEPTYGSTWVPAVKAIATGWQISMIGNLESGNTYTPYNTTGSSANDYDGPDLLNMVRNPNIGHFDKSFSRQFDTTAFTVPDNYVKGDSATGVIRGPGQLNFDLSAAKNFAIYERLHANIRADMFNAFNHAQWNNVCSTEPFCFDNSGTQIPFGQVLAGKEGRIFQFGGKIQF
jgi:Carboxypeptidase regulatory-like domain/TonB dependent receptor